ncbi:DNA polymerase III subunit delta' [Arhodomonas sp. SL1]|uniref:DNA polymerase III subunit delta' n=1 Tax=Arhodomonas sp. SL1 TaxID=3425691 RepID=UPI003F881A81
MTVTPDPQHMPWHDSAWGRLRGRIEAGTLAHALLIHGPRGVGRRALAGRIAARLLCRSPDAEGEACGHCHGCRLRRTGAHPDYHVVEVTEGRTRIRVGQIRELTEFANLSSQYGEHRVIALPEADRMNTEAANALLKTLEEPPARAVILLVCERPTALPATIRSRCQRIALQAPAPAAARRWLGDAHADAASLLGLAGGAPLRALALAEGEGLAQYRQLIGQLRALYRSELSPTVAAAQWQGMDRSAFIELLQMAAGEIARRAATGAGHGPEVEGLSELAAWVDCGAAQAFYRHVTRLRADAGQPLNAQLLIEGVLAQWVLQARDNRWGFDERD